MRVLLVDPSERGALPLYTALVAEGLVAAGACPVVLTSRHLLAPDLPAAWPVRRWLPASRWPPPAGTPPRPPWRQALTWLGCAAVIVVVAALTRTDVVHMQHPVHPRLDPALMRVLRRFVPVVLTAHDVVPHDPSSDTLARASRLYRSVDVVLVHSPPAAKDIERIASVVAVVVAHPVRHVARIPDQATARTGLGLPTVGRLAVAVGFIRAYKGYGLLADTWERLGEQAPALLIVGQLVDESERPVIDRLVAHGQVTVRLGYAGDDEVVAALAAADVVLLPHERGSDSGSLHMARSVGRPVLASDAPHLASVVLSTQAGRVLPRDPGAWAHALTGDLPPAPPAPPAARSTGMAHRSAYAQVLPRRPAT